VDEMNPMTSLNRRAHGGTTKYHGAKWIRPAKRLAIYVRDGLACVYCGHGVEDGALLSLDHVVPFVHGGSHEASNLLTSCRSCNSRRGDRDFYEWTAAVAAFRGEDAQAFNVKLVGLLFRPLDVAAAKAIIAAR
jgi:hypothetical protein